VVDDHAFRIAPAPDPVEAPHGRPAAGLTVAEVARRYRVSPDKVRAWIARGELKAVNTAAVLCGRPRWVIPAESLAEFEKTRRGGPAPKPQRQRRRHAQEIDFYPD
jgi:excisionase family DNA binding protein